MEFHQKNKFLDRRLLLQKLFNLKKLEKHRIISSLSQPINFPLIVNRTGILSLPAFQNQPVVCQRERCTPSICLSKSPIEFGTRRRQV